DELGGDVDLAYAYRMNPQHMPVGDRLFNFRAVAPKTLPKSLPPITPPPHLEKIKRRTQPIKQGEQDIIKNPHSASVLDWHRVLVFFKSALGELFWQRDCTGSPPKSNP